MTRCPNCGHINDKDASFCENCGANLRAPAGMSNLTKVLIIAVIVLVGVLGVAAGMIFLGGQKAPANNTTVVINQTNQQSASAEWHQIASFSGVNTEFHTFTSKGNKVKVVIRATPTYKNTSSYINTDITDGNKVYNSGTLSWSATTPVSTEERVLEINAPPGTYALHIYTKEIEGWTITVYDYY